MNSYCNGCIYYNDFPDSGYEICNANMEIPGIFDARRINPHPGCVLKTVANSERRTKNMYDLKIGVKVNDKMQPQEVRTRVERFFIKDGFLTLIYPDKHGEYMNSNVIFSIESYKVDEEEGKKEGEE